MDKIGEFLKKSGVEDKSLAHYYLEVSNNDVDEAVRLYLEDINVWSLTNAEEKCPKSKTNLYMLEWNIQGLLEDFLLERTMGVIKEILEKKPDVVFLQEVINSTFDIIKIKCNDYDVHVPRKRESYFVMVLTLKSSLCTLKKSSIDFKNSKQGRSLLKIEAKQGKVPVVIFTSHLESLKPESDARMSQFHQVCEFMMPFSPDTLVVFAADTNFRDFEYKQCLKDRPSIKEKIVDIWEEVGCPGDSRFTWDLQKNDNQIKGGKARLRFERAYCRSPLASGTCAFRPESISLVGTKRLDCGMFPSDHWGMLIKFSK